jgi:Raf kinase inhibitor-like YbhB/YbcL family protein
MSTRSKPVLASLFASLLSVAAAASLVVACSSSTASPQSTPAGADSGGADPDSAAADPDGGAGDPDSSATTDASRTFTLTSSALPEGATFPVDNTCTGTNVSPPLAWTAGPAATKSYAIVFHDTSNDFLHAITYDIPASVNALPAAMEAVYAPANPAGTHQTKSYKGVFGYAGPCPPSLHVYEFVLYALDVATLPGVTQNVALADAETAIKAHAIASTKLTGKYKKP